MQNQKSLLARASDKVLSSLILLNTDGLTRKIMPKSILILCYHTIIEESEIPTSWNQIRLKDFKEQMLYIKKHYNVVSMSYLLSRMSEKKKLPKHPAVITFDDCFASIKSCVAPVVEKLGIPITVYIPTGLIGAKNSIWTCELLEAINKTSAKILDLLKYGMEKYELDTMEKKRLVAGKLNGVLKKLPVSRRKFILSKILSQIAPGGVQIDECYRILSWPEIKELMKNKLFDFQPHTVNHEILSSCPEELQKSEILESIRDVEEQTGKRCTSFAYPNGSASDITDYSINLLRQSTLSGAVTTINGLNTMLSDRFYLKRVLVGLDTDMKRFRCAIAGIPLNLRNEIFSLIF